MSKTTLNVPLFCLFKIALFYTFYSQNLIFIQKIRNFSIISIANKNFDAFLKISKINRLYILFKDF